MIAIKATRRRDLYNYDESDSFYQVCCYPLRMQLHDICISHTYLCNSNIVTGGPSIIRKSNGERSNIELIASLRANFLAAQQDYSPPPSSPVGTNGDAAKTNGNGAHSRPAPSIWTSREGNDYYVPTIDWSLSGLAEESSQYNVTVKLFYLSGASFADRARHTQDAIDLVLRELSLPSIDLLIVSFPGLSFEGDCEWEADKKNSAQGNEEEEVEAWSTLEDLHNKGTVKRLGLAEFGSEKLRRFVERVKVRPSVDQINVKDCCNVPPPLATYAKQEGIELLTHNDCTDILPQGTLRELLGQGENGAGVLSDGKRGVDADAMKGDIKPLWVVKYTAVVTDRGVIENKGYFAAAELEE